MFWKVIKQKNQVTLQGTAFIKTLRNGKNGHSQIATKRKIWPISSHATHLKKENLKDMQGVFGELDAWQVPQEE